MGSNENLEMEGFKMSGSWPPVWWMELPFMMSNILKDLPFGKEDKRYVVVLKAQATYLRECSESLSRLFKVVEENIK